MDNNNRAVSYTHLDVYKRQEQQNLVRVNDILSELEKQIGPLEKQSETAKIYLKKKEELKTLDVNMFLLENQRLQEQMCIRDSIWCL